jgi:hypothetical protein
MSYDHDKQCQDNSIVVDTSTGHSVSSPGTRCRISPRPCSSIRLLYC